MNDIEFYILQRKRASVTYAPIKCPRHPSFTLSYPAPAELSEREAHRHRMENFECASCGYKPRREQLTDCRAKLAAHEKGGGK